MAANTSSVLQQFDAVIAGMRELAALLGDDGGEHIEADVEPTRPALTLIQGGHDG